MVGDARGREALRVLIWYWGRRGGGAHYSLALARALAQHPALEIHLSTSRQSEVRSAFQDLGLPHFELDTYKDLPSALWNSLRLPKHRRQFLDYLAENRIDLVLCTMCHPWSGWIAGKIPVPYVPVIHDAQPHPGDRLSGWPWLLRQTTRSAAGLIFLTDHVRKTFLQRFPYGGKTWVVPHGPLLLPRPPAPKQGPLRRLLFFGRILPYKGLCLLLEAFLPIAETYDLELLILGQGKLDAACAHRLPHPRVQFENHWIPEDALPQVFQGVDLLVLPYLESSQSGVIAAAYAMGVPVLSTPVGGLVEQVDHGKTGLIAESVSAEALRQALEILCRDAECLQRCREGAWEAGRWEPAWAEIARKLEGIFRELAS